MHLPFRMVTAFLSIFLTANFIYGDTVLTARSAAAVREYVELSTLDINWSISQINDVLSDHIAVAVGANDDIITMLCLEGAMNRVLPLHNDDGRLSELQISKDNNKFRHSSAVFFCQCKEIEPLFINCTSYSGHNYGDMFFFRCNLQNSLINRCPILQVNPFGATCQPGGTVLKQLFDVETNATKDGDSIKIFSALDGTLVQQYDLPIAVKALSLIGYTKDTAVLAEINSPSTDGNALPAGKPSAQAISSATTPPHDTTTAKPPFDPGCPYKRIARYDFTAKALKQIKPLFLDAQMGFSSSVRVNNHWVWWEYYPSEKSPNGIWILRAQENDEEPVLVTAIHNVDHRFFQWDGQNWNPLSNTVDPALPAVHLASDGKLGVISVLGQLCLVSFKEAAEANVAK